MDSRFNEIQTTILNARNEVSELADFEVLTPQEQTLLGASSTSKVAQWRKWIWIFTFGIWTLEKVIIENSKNTKEQNLPILKDTILNFHDGLELKFLDKTWSYDFTGVVNPDALKIVKNCAILQPEEGGLVLKITSEDGPLDNDQLNRFKTYMGKKKVPGIPIKIINKEADLLLVDITAYVNSEIIDLDTGRLLNVTEEIYPVKEAIQNYLSKLEFNGAFVKQFFEAEISTAEGTYLVYINALQWKYESYPFVDFELLKVPESGHFKILEENLTINYLSDAVVYN